MREQADKHWKAGEIWRIEILTEKADEKGNWGFLTAHKPTQPIGEAVEQHLKALKKEKEK